LGNILATITDAKIYQTNGSLAKVISGTDYYAFGAAMPSRSFQDAGYSKYRYGFNGKENDDDFQDYGMRVYCPECGVFLSVDPIASQYPFYSPYHFAGNKPIWAVDLDGLEPDFSKVKWSAKKDGSTTIIKVEGQATIKVKLINLSHEKVDLKVVKSEMETELNAHFSKSQEYSSGDARLNYFPDGSQNKSKNLEWVSYHANLGAKVEITIIDNIKSIGHDDYVAAIVDDIPRTMGSKVNPSGIAAGTSATSRIFLMEAKYSVKKQGDAHNTGTHEGLHVYGGLADDYNSITGEVNKKNAPNIMQGGSSNSNDLLSFQKSQIIINLINTMTTINVIKKMTGNLFHTHSKIELKEFIKSTNSTSTINDKK
jgi:RHS repeat-associated protein